MRILKKYTGDKTYMFPTGRIATPDIVCAEYSAVNTFTHIIETDESGEVMFAINNLSAMRTMYEIDKTLTEDEAIIALQEILNTPPPEPEASAEERIAAALEYQNLTA